MIERASQYGPDQVDKTEPGSEAALGIMTNLYREHNFRDGYCEATDPEKELFEDLCRFLINKVVDPKLEAVTDPPCCVATFKNAIRGMVDTSITAMLAPVGATFEGKQKICDEINGALKIAFEKVQAVVGKIRIAIMDAIQKVIDKVLSTVSPPIIDATNKVIGVAKKPVLEMAEQLFTTFEAIVSERVEEITNSLKDKIKGKDVRKKLSELREAVCGEKGPVNKVKSKASELASVLDAKESSQTLEQDLINPMQKLVEETLNTIDKEVMNVVFNNKGNLDSKMITNKIMELVKSEPKKWVEKLEGMQRKFFMNVVLVKAGKVWDDNAKNPAVSAAEELENKMYGELGVDEEIQKIAKKFLSLPVIVDDVLSQVFDGIAGEAIKNLVQEICNALNELPCMN
jgi:hypothetical protein